MALVELPETPLPQTGLMLSDVFAARDGSSCRCGGGKHRTPQAPAPLVGGGGFSWKRCCLEKGSGADRLAAWVERAVPICRTTMHVVLLGLKKSEGDLEAKFNEVE